MACCIDLPRKAQFCTRDSIKTEEQQQQIIEKADNAMDQWSISTGNYRLMYPLNISATAIPHHVEMKTTYWHLTRCAERPLCTPQKHKPHRHRNSIRINKALEPEYLDQDVYTNRTLNSNLVLHGRGAMWNPTKIM